MIAHPGASTPPLRPGGVTPVPGGVTPVPGHHPGGHTGGHTGGGGFTPVPGGFTPVPGGGFTPVPSAHATGAGSGAVAAAAVASAPSAAPSLVGTVLADRYRVIKKLGEGGMGSVYLAEHTTINKKLAIKVLSSEYSHKQDLVDRFLQEARAASMIAHENVVEITDFGSTPSGSVFFVMEFLNGEDLSKTIKKTGPLPWTRVKPIMLQICSALTAAHESGIIHRDMKPENCYRIKRGGGEDFIKVLDFGIAKVTSDDGEGGVGGKGLTRTGMIFGTPEYMSPEQAKGEKVDHRVDVYAVGVILYELLTGKVPFTADTFMGILTKHMFEAPPAPSTVAPGIEVPPQVEAIILKALQKDREYRFQSMREMADAILQVGTDSAPVAVVQEDVILPTGGATRFRTSSSVAMPAAARAETVAPPARRRSGTGMLIGVAAFVLALGGAGAVIMMSGDDPKRSDVPAAAADPGPAPKKATKTDPKPPDGDPKTGDPKTGDTKAGDPKAGDTKAGGEVPPVVAKVAITVSTPGIAGEVVDGRDDAVLGKTNAPFQIPLGRDPIDLYVRAEGYEQTLVPVVPDADKTLPATLEKLPAGTKPKTGGQTGGQTGSKSGPTGSQSGSKTGGKTGSNTKTGDTKSGDTKTGDTKTGDTKSGGTKTGGKTGDTKTGDTKTGGSGSPDLKDPFKR